MAGPIYTKPSNMAASCGMDQRFVPTRVAGRRHDEVMSMVFDIVSVSLLIPIESNHAFASVLGCVSRSTVRQPGSTARAPSCAGRAPSPLHMADSAQTSQVSGRALQLGRIEEELKLPIDLGQGVGQRAWDGHGRVEGRTGRPKDAGIQLGEEQRYSVAIGGEQVPVAAWRPPQQSLKPQPPEIVGHLPCRVSGEVHAKVGRHLRTRSRSGTPSSHARRHCVSGTRR